MNNRIKELAKSVQCERHWTEEDIEKFAELIVRECVERIKRVGILEDIENETDMVVDAVKEHFGVE